MALMRYRGLVFAILVVLTLPCADASDTGVVLSASVTPKTSAFGVPLQLSVRIENSTSTSLLLLVRDVNFGIEISDERGQKITVYAPRYTRERSSFADDEVPLLPGAAYIRPLPVPLNDLTATPGEGWLAESGRYSLKIIYDSDRSKAAHNEPIWRGTLESNSVEFDIRPPDSSMMLAYHERLVRCVEDSSSCDGLAVANFYRANRDTAAADLLLKMLASAPYELWWLDAIVAQGRAADADAIREIASHVEDEALQALLQERAATLQRAASMDRRRDAKDR
ncbi:MAG TPA: hypothetical protein VFN10_15035 [Thermoanaerobaculia bacterium]|nr:hypothetical protein [Thermoanaerobaculia bacterium]